VDEEGAGSAVSEAPETIPSLVLSGRREARAIAVPGEGTALSYGELAARIEQLARALARAGVGRGARVALAHPEGPAFVELLLATLSLGAAAAPLNPAYTADELAFYLEDLAPLIVLLPAAALPAAREAAARLGIQVADVSESGGGLDVAGTAAAPAAGGRAEPGPGDVAILLHTSGTTSRPKQVPLLHRNLAASARTIAAHYALSEDDVSFCAMPLFHVHGLVASVLGALAAGGSVLIPRRFTPRGLVQALATEGVTWFSASPTVLEMVLERAEREAGGAPPASLRFIRSCSSALPERLLERLEQRFGAPVLEAYGMTEASHQMASNPPPPAPRVPGSVGIAAGAEIAIARADGTPLGPGEVGEVLVRGPGVTPGYLDNPEANASAFVGGWFRTGDLGSLDERGYLRLQGRIKELVIRGGENISPYEVEDALTSHPGVREAACFGVPDEKYGEEVGAVVALAPGVTREQVLEHCRTRLAAFKVPKTLVVVDAIPRTATGKLQRQRLPALLGLLER
jgi:acyl-CoA synthetase (AMP-forming)/AMP-acid ligase II